MKISLGKLYFFHNFTLYLSCLAVCPLLLALLGPPPLSLAGSLQACLPLRSIVGPSVRLSVRPSGEAAGDAPEKESFPSEALFLPSFLPSILPFLPSLVGTTRSSSFALSHAEGLPKIQHIIRSSRMHNYQFQA